MDRLQLQALLLAAEDSEKKEMTMKETLIRIYEGMTEFFVRKIILLKPRAHQQLESTTTLVRLRQ